MSYYDFDVRIAYADTDRMGVVYYANYLVLFERGPHGIFEESRNSLPGSRR